MNPENEVEGSVEVPLENLSKYTLIDLLKKSNEENFILRSRLLSLGHEVNSPAAFSPVTETHKNKFLELNGLGSNSISFLEAADESLGLQTSTDWNEVTSTERVRQEYLQLVRGSKAFKAPDVLDYHSLFESTITLEYEADSPPFRGKIEEMDTIVDGLRQHLQHLVDRCRNYCEKGNTYSDVGRSFCSLLTGFTKDETWSAKLGDVAPLLAKFGEVLDEIQAYRDGVLSSLEMTFSAPMEEFVKREVKTVKKLKQDVAKSAEEYEAGLAKFQLLKASIDPEMLSIRETELALLRSKFEMYRYDLVVELNSLGTKKKFQLCERVCSALYAYLGFFHQCHTLIATIEPAMRQLTSELNSARKDFAREQLLWCARRNKLHFDLDRLRSNPRAGGGFQISRYWRPRRLNSTRGSISEIDVAYGFDAAHPSMVSSSPASASSSSLSVQLGRLGQGGFQTPYKGRPSLNDNGTDEGTLTGNVKGLLSLTKGRSAEPGSYDGAGDDWRSNRSSWHGEESSGHASSKGPKITEYAKSGFLWKRSSNLKRDWQRRWFFITDGKLFYTKGDDLTVAHAQLVCDLLISTVKLNPETDIRFTFELVSPGQRRYASSLCVSVCLYATLCVSVCLYATLCVSVCLYATLCDSVCLYATLCDSVCLYATLCVSVSMCLCVSVSLCDSLRSSMTHVSLPMLVCTRVLQVEVEGEHYIISLYSLYSLLTLYRRYVLQGEGEDDRDDWVRAIKQQIEGLIAALIASFEYWFTRSTTMFSS